MTSDRSISWSANLYPFGSDPSIDLIDIGGPTMVRAAAKNHAHVAVLVDPADYDEVLDEIAARGTTSPEAASTARSPAPSPTRRPTTRRSSPGSTTTTALPDSLHLAATRAETLRYGENPHQVGARYTFGDSCWDDAVQHGGKEMSYLNVYDADAAWRLVWSLGEGPAAVVIKHANPCGAAVADDIAVAYRLAHECDPGVGLRRDRGGQPARAARDGRGTRSRVHRGAHRSRL